jgi:hypothetical protein
MTHSCIELEREALSCRRHEIVSKLEELTVPGERSDPVSDDVERGVLLCRIREIDRRLTDISLDERSLCQMEGRE